MPSSDKDPNPTDDVIYRAILIVLAISSAIGVALALWAESMEDSVILSRSGAGLALVSAALYVVFRWLGRRAQKRHEAQGDREPPGHDGQGESP